MQYIENNELREWVKFELKKTIFTKAHALAVQTGCDILVKLQDLSSPTAHQSYSTGPLRKAYNNCTLRRDPSEKSVSGETGLPLSDQAVQSDNTEIGGLQSQDQGAVGDLVTHESFASDNEMQGDYSAEQSDNVVTQQDGTLPMHLTAVSNNSHVQDDASNSESQQFESDLDISEVHVKQEPVEAIDISEEADMKPPEEENLANFEQQFHIPASHELPTFVQPPVVGRIARSTVPLSPKPYQCGVCHKAFRSVHVLQKHTQTFHTKPHQIKLAPRVSRGRGGRSRGGSHFLNRPSHQAPQTSTYPVFPGAGGDQAPITTQQQDTLLQDIPGTSSQQMAQMAQLASAQQFPTSTPVAVTPSTSDFSPSPSGPMFQSPSAGGPSVSSSPMQQGRHVQGYVTSIDDQAGQQALLECISVAEPMHSQLEGGENVHTLWPYHFPIEPSMFPSALWKILVRKQKISGKSLTQLFDGISSVAVSYTLYPNASQYDSIVRALLHRFPHLGEGMGREEAHNSWKSRIRSKFKNMRRRSEHPEVQQSRKRRKTKQVQETSEDPNDRSEAQEISEDPNRSEPQETSEDLNISRAQEISEDIDRSAVQETSNRSQVQKTHEDIDRSETHETSEDVIKQEAQDVSEDVIFIKQEASDNVSKDTGTHEEDTT